MRLTKLHIIFVIFILVLSASCKDRDEDVSLKLDEYIKDKSFTVAFIPDTQYLHGEKFEGFNNITDFLAKYADRYDVRLCIQLGDITDTNSESEWEEAKLAMDKLSGRLSYAVIPGNHDYANDITVKRSDMLNKYFPLEKLSAQPYYGGSFNGNSDNTYYLIEEENKKYMLLCLEMCPSYEVVDWANSLTKEYSDFTVIISTHAFISDKAILTHSELPVYYSQFKNLTSHQCLEPLGLYKKYIEQNSNIGMVVCAHYDANKLCNLYCENGVPCILTNYHGSNSEGRVMLINISQDGYRICSYCPYTDTVIECIDINI